MFLESAHARNLLIASFFCSHNFNDRCIINLIIPTLAIHLTHQYAGFKTTLIPIISSNPDIGYESLADQLKHLLVQPLGSIKLSTTIVIDTIDKCEGDKPASEILSILAQHMDTIASVKFFLLAGQNYLSKSDNHTMHFGLHNGHFGHP